MKPRRPTEYEVFNSNVKQIISKSDSITENVQKSRVPAKLDTYIGTSSSYFSDNGSQYIDGKTDMIFRFSSLPVKTKAYSKLQSSTYCKPYVKAGPSANGDGVKKYYSSPSFSDSGTVLGVNRYLSTEIYDNEEVYYFLGDGTDKTVSGVKYYIKSIEVINNYLVSFYDAIVKDQMVYPILVFLDGFFVPWSKCYFALSYDDYKIYVDMSGLKYTSSSYLVDLVREKLVTGEIEPIFYMLPFEVKYGENVNYSTINKSKTIFTFDSYGRSYRTFSTISDTTKVTYIEALINIKNINDPSTTDIYDQNSDLFYCEVNAGSSGSSDIGKTVVKFNKLDRMRKLFPNNIMVFNRDNADNLNLTLCTDTIRIYNNIVYVGTGTTYYDQHIKVFFDTNSALSLTNLEFVSQNWLQDYTDTLIRFYNLYNINYADSGEIEVPNNENIPIGLRIVDGVLNMEYDPLESEEYNLPDPTQLGYTIKDGILCMEYDEDNINSVIINDNYIAEQLNTGSLYTRISMDNDTYNFDELYCYYYDAEKNTKTQLPIDKAKFFNIYNKIYHRDVYNRNKGKLPMMDQTTASNKVFEIKNIGVLSSINSYYAGENLTLKYMSFDDDVFLDKISSTLGDAVGKYKFVYVASNDKNDRYGYATISSDLQPGSTIDPDSLKMRSAKFVEELMNDDLDSPLGIRVGPKVYTARKGYIAYTSYTFATKAASIENYTDSGGYLLQEVEVFHDEDHDSFYLPVGDDKYYVKEYSNEKYDSTTGKSYDKTGSYNLNVEDFAGVMTITYDDASVATTEARMNDVQLSNSVIDVQPNGDTTVNLSTVNFSININKYVSNFDYSFISGAIVTDFICTDGGTLTYENTGDTVTVSDEELLYETFSMKPGSYSFKYDSDNSYWRINDSFTVSDLTECGITYAGTDDFTIIIKVDTAPTWTLDSNPVDIEDVYGITFDGIVDLNLGNKLSLTYTKTITGMVEETYDEDAENPQTIMNDYLQLKLEDGVTNVVYNSYLIDMNVDPYRPYPGRIEFVYSTPLNHWVVTVYREVTDDLVYKTTFNYSNLDGFGIEYTGSPVDGDMIIVNYEPPIFQWNIYKANPTNSDDFNDGYLYPDSPTVTNVNISDYGIGIIANINQSTIVNAKIVNEDILADKLNGVSGVYVFSYNELLDAWIYGDEYILLSEYGISIGNSTPSDGDYIIIELNTSNSPSWMDSMFVTIYEVNKMCLEFPDGTYYNQETAIPIINDSYGIDIYDYYDNMKINDKIVIEYQNFVKIPRYILNLLINKFNYIDTFEGQEIDVINSYQSSYETYDEKIADIYKMYKLYEYQIATMMLNNQSIFDNYLRETFTSNLRFAEYTRDYIISNGIAVKRNNIYCIDIPIKNRQAYMIDFENMYLNYYIDDNMTRDITSNIFRYKLSLALSRYSKTNTPVEFMFFDNIDNRETNINISADDKYRKYDTSIFNENMRLYSTTIPSGNEFEYPTTEDDYPVDISFNVKYTIDKIRYKGILTPGSSAAKSIYTPAAAKGDFYYLKNNGYVNDTNISNATTYRLLLCTKDVYDASEVVFDEIKPSTDDDTCWKLVAGSDLIDGLSSDYSILELDQEYIKIILSDSSFYNTDLTVTSINRFKYYQFQYKDPTGDYQAIDNDTNTIVLQDPTTHTDIFKYCDDRSRYMVFISYKSGSSYGDYRYVSSDQYRLSIPNDYSAPYYKRKMFFTFDIPEDAHIVVLYIPVSFEAVEFKQRAMYDNGTIIFDISYESKKNNHYTLNSDLYMVFADGLKIPQSWIQLVGPDKLSLKIPSDAPSGTSISHNNISIVRYMPTSLESRFDNYIDSNELQTISDNIDPTDENFMKYIMKVGLTKNDILNILEKLTYRHRYAGMGTECIINDDIALNNYGSGMADFVYWLYEDINKSPDQKLAVFDYNAINMTDAIYFANNNKFIESTVKLIREFYIENTLVPYNTSENPAPTFNNQDNIASKSEGLSSNTRYANDPSNIYVYPVLQDYRFDVIYATYNLVNLTTNGRTVINPGEVSYSFNIYPVNGSYLPTIANFHIYIDKTGAELRSGVDYYYNPSNGQVIVYSINDNFTVVAYGERVSEIRVTKDPDKTLYYTTEMFDPTGMVVSVVWTNGNSEVIPSEQYTVTYTDQLLTEDVTEVIITYRDSDFFNYETTLHIEVLKATEELNYVKDGSGTYYIIGDGSEGSGLTAIPEGGEVIIPDTVYNTQENKIYEVKEISDIAFKGLGIASVSLGANITKIGVNAFQNSTVESVSMSKALEEIDNGAFMGCTSLMSISIPSNVTVLGISVFYGCSSLTSCVIPSNDLNGIPQTTFYGCTSLYSINIPDNIKSIGNSCFEGCSALEIVDIDIDKSKLNSIGEKAFYQCSSLTAFNIPTNMALSTIDKDTFNGSKLVELLIPNNITVVNDNAFSNCTYLESVRFDTPNGEAKPGISTLGKLIFENCTSLTDVEFGFTASLDKCTSTDISWFKGCNTGLSIKVPKTVYDEDQSIDLTETNYGTYWNYIDADHNATYYSDNTPS